MKKIKLTKWFLLRKVLPMTLVITGMKAVFVYFHLELFPLDQFTSALVSANIFILGFLLNSAIRDYQESDRLPLEVASNIEAIYDECEIIYTSKKSPAALECIEYLIDFTKSVERWIHKEERTHSILKKINGLNSFFLRFEPLTQANFIVRMKQEQNNLRKNIQRINAIRDVHFVSSAYAIAEINVLFLVLSLLFTRTTSSIEGVFYVGILILLILYIMALIKDMDNPFDYHPNKERADEISFIPVFELKKTIQERLDVLNK